MKRHRVKKIVYGLLAILWLVVAVEGFFIIQSENLRGGNQQSGSAGDRKLKVINFGYQRGDEADLVRINGQFASDAKKLGYRIRWTNFQDGPTMLSALTSHHIRFARTGNTPPVVSQAGGSDIVYVAATVSKYRASMILVPKDSTISNLSDLRGKRIAYGFGTASTYLLLKALQSADLTLSDVNAVNLNQSAAGTAFKTGRVDAWVTWDPFSAAAQVEDDAQVLANAKGLSGDHNFFTSTRSWANKHKDLLRLLNRDAQTTMTWANNNHALLIRQFTKDLGLSQRVARLQVGRRTYGMSNLTDPAIVNEQQDIADLLYQNKMIDRRIRVKNAFIDLGSD
ncbi:aliphatic sulfonate ABC transporter substrate-binding protein [Oenococcus sp.]|uniref:aliphatic sulfonate ABC transporter substrate-binding protein n=1 Tax=Oenococcus sp. TaxID=1979414 RepID=UPI0039E9A9D9